MTTKTMVDKLYDWVEMVSTITCSKCDKSSSVHEDEWVAAETFFKNGWTVNKVGDVCCPDCTLKAKKQKNGS